MGERLEGQSGLSQKEQQQTVRGIIVVVGPEGSGKTTQAERLADLFRIPRVGMGDVFRELSSQDTDLGARSREILEGYKYSDDSLFHDAFQWRIKKEDVANGFIFDGGFRTLGQVEQFEDLLKEGGKEMPVLCVVYIRIPVWASFVRQKERGREDSTDEAMQIHQRQYYYQLGKRMSFAENRWPFYIINAWNKSEEELNIEIRNKIKEVRMNERSSN